MPCLCGGAKVSSDSGNLTEVEISHVQTTWKVLHADWDEKHGMAFFLRLFKKYPGFKGYFEAFKDQPESQLVENDTLKAHVIVFGGALDKLVTSLGNTSTVVDILHKLTDSHVARGLGVNDFKNSLDCFAGFAFETGKLNKDQKNAWIKTSRVIMKVIGDYADELAKK